ncbi:TerB family tellurite resistance protein [Salipiger sp.]|uniref:TerB family tellurite resistance protein n=1 Tax=Salipiger sp. TaxID=2078585 RepID=UPI003A96EE42
MSLLFWLSSRAPDLETPPEPIRTQADIAPTPLTDLPDDEDHDVADETDEIALDELFCIIDYRAENGETSRRRITLLKVAPGPNAPILSAVCHERRAFRQFRCDRIACFIEPDGEVIECSNFFQNHLAIDLASLSPSKADLATPVAREIREHLRPALSILVTAATSDGEFHAEELDSICQYIEGELMLSHRCERFREAVTIDVLDQLTKIVSRMRPQRSSIPGYLSKILDYEREDLSRFGKALEHVVVADGVFNTDEKEFLEELANFAAAHDFEVKRQIAGLERDMKSHAASSPVTFLG